MSEGIIVRGVGGGVYEVDFKNEYIMCKAKGALRHEQISPYVGDKVEIEDADGTKIISEIKERKNLFIRPPIANLDMLFCVIPCKNPLPDIFTLDKLISIAESASAQPVIVITKADLDKEKADELYKIYSKAGFKVFSLSVYESESVEALASFIKSEANGKISAFAGASGAGKSTLMNYLFKDFKAQIGDVSRKTARGRHTTRSVTLYKNDGGYIADTPGFTMLDFERFDFFDLEELPYTFREFDEYIGKCKYVKCTHLCEDGCAIVKALSENEISPSRHESYVSLYATLKAKPFYKKKK